LSLGGVASQLRVRPRVARRGVRLFSRGCLQPYRRVAGEVEWSLTGVIATHLLARSYVYITINMVGRAGLAAINGVGLFFRPVGTLVTAWAIAGALQCMEYTIGIALQAAREFKFLAYTTLTTAPLIIVATAGVILWHGYTWPMYGVALGYTVALVMGGTRLDVVHRRFIDRVTSPDRVVG